MNPTNRNKLSQIAASKLGARLFRMQVGLFWAGKSQRFERAAQIKVQPGDVLIRQGRPVKVGEEGMGDGIGFVSRVITPDMVGQKVAVYLSIEDKAGTGKASQAQKAWKAMVRSFGGLAGLARTDEDVRRIIAGEVVD
jgi:hypothetical protein